MKKLYVSDLDGTLLNKKREVSVETAEILNRFIDKGGLFTVATARMPYTCDFRLKDIHLNMPAILMNGVMLYDFRTKKCLDYDFIEVELWKKALSIIQDNQCNCYLYTYWNQAINLYFENPELDFEGQYYSERSRKGCGFAGQIESFDAVKEQDVIYIAAIGEETSMRKVQSEIEQLEDITCSGYVNIYNGGYCLEIYSSRVNKAERALQLKKSLASDKLIGFGDNYNDVKLMKVADESYAPENALDDVKEIANEVLLSNDEDGVASYIAEVEGII